LSIKKSCIFAVGWKLKTMETNAEPMTQQLIETLFAKRTRNTLGKIKSPKQQLSFEQLKIYYEEAGKILNE
jgi:hypothetical protein